MASLQTLRNKGGFIVAGIIGLALVAFVLGDLFTSGSTLYGESKNKVGEIAGEKIDYQEYANQLNYLSEIQKISTGGQGASTDEENEALRNQTWDYLIRQHALKPALEQAGFNVTKEEMVQLISGEYLSPMIAQMFTNPATGTFDPVFMNNFVKNIDKDTSGRTQMFWSYLQQEVHDQSQITKYKNVIDKGCYVTTFEAEKVAQLEGNNINIRLVASNFSQIADSTVVVNESEMKDFHKKHPNMFKINESRTIEYVSFQALPSASDYEFAEKYINDLVDEFATTDHLSQFVALNSQEPMDTRYYKESELRGELGGYAFSDSAKTKIYGPQLTNDQYTLSRVADMRMVPDSVDFSHIALTLDQKKMADSLLVELRKGADFSETARSYSKDEASASEGGKLGIMDPQTMAEAFSTVLLKAKVGEIALIETPQSIHIIKVNEIKGINQKVQMATIKYTIEPSESTYHKVFNDANMFASAVAKDGFDKVVAAQDLGKRSVNISPNDNSIRGLDRSRELVRWAYNAKVNEVSNVRDYGNNYVVAVLKSTTPQGVMSFQSAEEEVKSILINQKKGELLTKKMTGANSLEELSAKLSVDIVTASDINMSTYVIPAVGYDPSLVGAVCGLGTTTNVSKPIVGSTGVYVIQVDEVVKNPIDIAVMKVRLSAEHQQRAFMGNYNAIVEMSKIKDLRYRFY